MAAQLNMKEMLEAGVHFGHQTRRWNPKMRQFIYSQRDGVHIIDLGQTVQQAAKAAKAVTDVVGKGGNVLFIGTKKQASEIIKEEAIRCNQFFMTNRWLGGTLTNFKTIKASIDRLKNLEERREKGELDKFVKKEALRINRTIEKLENSLGGIKEMTRAPDIIFLVDPNHERIAKLEAKKLGIPVIAMIDTNCDPDGIDYPIASNDDAIRSIQLFAKVIADASLAGDKLYEIYAREQDAKRAEEKQAAKGKRAVVKEQKMERGKARAYTAKKPDEKAEELSKDDIEKFATAKAEDDQATEAKKDSTDKS